jgi:hypothetical protein
MPGWIKDGTWPIDPKTKRALAPPDSPFLSARNVPDEPFLLKDGLAMPIRRMRTAEQMQDGLIGEDDLHVGADVWRGAEEGLVKESNG